MTAAWTLMMACGLIAGVSGGLGVSARAAERTLVRQYLADVAEEDPEARRARHEAVAARRAGPLVIVRRGASALAPEDSLAACAAAMDYGADGCRVEVRRTKDGVPVVFPEESLDRLTPGFGAVREVLYADLAALSAKKPGLRGHGRSAVPPTLAAVLDLARERRMLLHLELSDPACEEEVVRLLTAAETWDHLVEVSPGPADRLARDQRLHRLRYKAPDLYRDRRDLDPPSVKAAIERPGQMILVDDPRVAAWVLGRPAYRPQPYTETLHISARPLTATNTPGPAEFQPLAWIRSLEAVFGGRPSAELLLWMRQVPPNESWGGEDPSDSRWAIVRRAWLAQTLGTRGRPDAAVVQALERVVRQPTWHTNLAYNGLDAACAVRSLGWLGSTRSVPLLIRSLQSGSDGVQGHGETPGAGSEPETREAGSGGPRSVFTALGDLPCSASRRFLRAYLERDARSLQGYGPPQHAEATRALLRQRVDWTEIAALLRSPNLSVRGTALLECLDRPTEERSLALRRAMPWALSLPGGGIHRGARNEAKGMGTKE